MDAWEMCQTCFSYRARRPWRHRVSLETAQLYRPSTHDQRKSQLAIQYAHQIRQRALNTWVFWVHASTRGRFEEAYRSIADRLELPRRNDPDVNIFRLVSEWLRVEENGSWEMILDNADDVDVFFSTTQERLASFLPQNCNGSIVVTSRNMDVAERLVGGWSNILTIPAMKTEEACQLLQEKLEVGYDAGAATDLVRALDHMPLAITQAAAFINRRAPRMSIPTYLNEFRGSNKKKASILNKDAGDLRRDESASNSIVTTWQITFEQIRRERPSAANLLSFMSFFNPQGIPESALQAYARDHKEDVLEDDLETLRGYLLVAVMADKEIFEMHALVQFCTQVWLSSFSNIQRWKREFLKVISDQYPSGEYKNWPECKRLDPHIDKILKEEPNSTEDVLRWARLLTNAGWYRWMKGIYEEAGEMNQLALETRERVLGREHPDTLMSVHILAGVLQYQGKYEEAEQMNRRALEGYEKVLGREHPDTLTSISNLALLLQYQGKYEEAEEMNRRALDAWEKVLGREHPDTLTSISNLALVLQYQGKYEEAEQMNRRALEGYEKVLGREHPDTLTSISNLVLVLQYHGKYEEAEQMNRRTLHAREKVLGREHPDTLTSVSNLASVLRYQGKYKEAEQMNRRALEGYEKVLGREHPSTLTSISNLAEVLRHQGKYEEAEQMNRRALDASEKVLGREHPSTLTSINNLAFVLRYQGKYEEAEQMNRRALDAREKVLGREHPSTFASINNLASVLRYQGKYEEAEQMNRRALDAREKVLGREHPSTLTSVNNLAWVLGYQGKYEEAEQMNRRALDASEKALGREHPDTLTSVYNLAYLFHGQTRFSEAAKLYERACDGYVEVLGFDHPTTRACVAHYRSLREDMANSVQKQ
ncbi:hypothetical protein BGZ61DRAFT_116342 [Ilyonectria robusta]|uniref:uncharacterized protein n=1 Tax=Ilyonectria robusta TaxID=1079257 RepID=UPI001E8E364D|nr:uncharacterized protein BGZ61DRAFT_116342 [Ilyonectria robusta]KAH8669304.1 hypothetical protein BGZ61DRAFT_116342 [Ilyonectria robusta]